jgi:ribonuclease P protein component
MRRSAEFAATLAKGRRARAGTAVVYAAPAPEQSWKAGFIVSKQVGNAVARNRVTRRLRAIAAAQVPGLAPGQNVVVRALRGTASCNYNELSDAVRAALAKAVR